MNRKIVYCMSISLILTLLSIQFCSSEPFALVNTKLTLGIKTGDVIIYKENSLERNKDYNHNGTELLKNNETINRLDTLSKMQVANIVNSPSKENVSISYYTWNNKTTPTVEEVNTTISGNIEMSQDYAYNDTNWQSDSPFVMFINKSLWTLMVNPIYPNDIDMTDIITEDFLDAFLYSQMRSTTGLDGLLSMTKEFTDACDVVYTNGNTTIMNATKSNGFYNFTYHYSGMNSSHNMAINITVFLFVNASIKTNGVMNYSDFRMLFALDLFSLSSPFRITMEMENNDLRQLCYSTVSEERELFGFSITLWYIIFGIVVFVIVIVTVVFISNMRKGCELDPRANWTCRVGKKYRES